MSVVVGVPGALDVRVRVRRGAFELTAETAVAPGEVLGIIGANGSGKSTLIEAVAGTLSIDEGRIALGDRVLSEAETGIRPVTVARAARRVGHLDQRARLFPHLDAEQNIAFGPRAQGTSKRVAAARAAEWLARMGLAGRERARVGELSGGQQQRVAIARTLAAEPSLLLLDEPFAALDVTAGDELRLLLADEIHRLGIPALLITHDPVDLIALADRAIVLEAGRVAQRGTVASVLDAPVTPFAAEFAGRCLLTGTLESEGALRVEGAPVEVLRGRAVRERATPETVGSVGAAEAPGIAAVSGASACASFRPGDVRLDPEPGREHVGGSAHPAAEAGVVATPADPEPRADADANSDATAWTGTVATVSAGRTGVRVECAEWPGFFAEVPPARALELALRPGSRVRLELAVAAVTVAAVEPLTPPAIAGLSRVE
ncbi:MAG: ATP-binding cassette domain-containing protein [Leucobacter sp.]